MKVVRDKIKVAGDRTPPTPREVRCPDCLKISFTRNLKKTGSRFYCPLCNTYIGTRQYLPGFRA